MSAGSDGGEVGCDVGSHPTVMSIVILTQGDRPAALARAVESARRAAVGITERKGAASSDAFASSAPAIQIEVVVVANGVTLDAAQSSVADRVVSLPDNVGIPAGRNAGALAATGELLFFLDDDAALDPATSLRAAVDSFSQRPELGALALRIVDEDGHTMRRHVPRVGAASAEQSGDVAQFLGGASIIRRRAFADVGGYPGEFFYAMEESDLALRLVDAGYAIHYAAELVVVHPRTLPSRHPGALQRTARNRVWLAHRLLPLPVACIYVALWTAISVARNVQTRSAVGAVLAGTRDGLRYPLGPRRPISWSAVWTLTHLGRPPII